ncbi:MAG: alpha/beta hydrolase [Roseinatronobacter sp.]
MATVGKLLLALAALVIAMIALLAAFQTSMLFPRALVGPAPDLPAGTTRLELRSQDGDMLHGVRIAGRDPARPVILGFGGNAWNAEAMALFLHQIAPEHDVVTFHYRGYAPSTGRPSAQALMADAVAVHDLIVPRSQGVIAVGFSIGSGIAAHLAAERDIARVVLVTPFDSLSAVARQLYPFAPVGLLFRHEMDAGAALSRSSADMRLILATRDEVIPPARAEALAAALPAAQVTRIETGHNAIYGHPDFVPALRAALAH